MISRPYNLSFNDTKKFQSLLPQNCKPLEIGQVKSVEVYLQQWAQ